MLLGDSPADLAEFNRRAQEVAALLRVSRKALYAMVERGEIPGVAKSVGASPATPKKIGTWIYPNPQLALDALDPALAEVRSPENIVQERMVQRWSSSSGPLFPGAIMGRGSRRGARGAPSASGTSLAGG